MMTDEQIKMLHRAEIAKIDFTDTEKKRYMNAPDDLGVSDAKTEVPEGYKRCGHCGHIKKFYLFNKNNATSTCCSGNCKECQKASAKKSYAKTKTKRNHKKYYQKNKEAKRESARKYYEANKEEILQKQREYHVSGKGKKVMKKAHKKRRAIIKANAGIAYTRQLVIDRDKQGQEFPTCYLCGKPITNIDGEHLHLDHVVSLNNGGTDCFTNIACVHKECNLRKTKDDREIDPKDVQDIVDLAEAYIDLHPEDFE